MRLGRRALNRATLERQLLLRRARLPAVEAIDHLIGIQAQAPNAPYVSLWARLAGFHPDELARLLSQRRAARAPLMRATIHLAGADDCLALRPVLQPVLERGFAGSPFARQLTGMDMEALLAEGRALLAERPRTRGELGRLLAARWPDRDATCLAYAISYLVPLVQVPPRGIWGERGPATWTTTEAWLGRPLSPDRSVEQLVLRYLAAFGPATVNDAQTWSGLTRLREILERLRPRLATFRDQAGNELFDLPDAPRPDADTPAPPRFLAEYDNLLLSHADRGRVVPDGRRVPLFAGNGGVLGTVLVDGFFHGTWRITRHRDTATLTIELFAALPGPDHTALVEEGMRLLALAADDAATHDARVIPTGPVRSTRGRTASRRSPRRAGTSDWPSS
jgi:Winged helix DNA-binding domain